MKVTLEPTSTFVEIADPNGGKVTARVWEGVTDSDTPISVLIVRVAVDGKQPAAELAAALKETRAPSPVSVNAWPTRLVL